MLEKGCYCKDCVSWKRNVEMNPEAPQWCIANAFHRQGSFGCTWGHSRTPNFSIPVEIPKPGNSGFCSIDCPLYHDSDCFLHFSENCRPGPNCPRYIKETK